MRLPTIVAAALAVLSLSAAPGQAQPAKPWYKQPWDPARVQACDRACLVAVADGYLHALETKDRSGLPLAEEVAFTENAGRLDLGQGALWLADVKPTNFKVVIADPVSGQVVVQLVYLIQGRPAQVAIRLKVERRMITEVEHLYNRTVAPQAMELLQTPRPALVNDVAPAQRSSREYMIYAANAYFDALTGEDGKIAPFADECVRHEQGYQTVNNKTPGRGSPSPNLPDTSTAAGRRMSALSVMTCEQQVSTKIFANFHKIWPRRVVVDEQKGLVAALPLFVLDGTGRKVDPPTEFSPSGSGGGGLIQNLLVLETFGIRNNKIYEIEAFPFVNLPLGVGDGWTVSTPH